MTWASSSSSTEPPSAWSAPFFPFVIFRCARNDPAAQQQHRVPLSRGDGRGAVLLLQAEQRQERKKGWWWGWREKMIRMSKEAWGRKWRSQLQKQAECFVKLITISTLTSPVFVGIRFYVIVMFLDLSVLGWEVFDLEIGPWPTRSLNLIEEPSQ